MGWASSAGVSLFYAVIPIVNGAASLIALPAISSQYGADGWASVAIGASVGAFATIAVELGWGLDGPLRVARIGGDGSKRIYAVSLLSRVAILPIAALPAMALSGLLASDGLAASAMAFVGSAVGLSPAWFFAGRGTPGWTLLSDSLPRVALASLSAGLIARGAPLITYPFALGAGAVLAPIIGGAAVGAGPRYYRGWSLRRVGGVVVVQWQTLRGHLAVALYRASPVALVGLVSPSSVPLFAAVDRLQKMALQLLGAASQLQAAWIGASPEKVIRLARARKAVWATCAYSLLAALVFTCLAPPATTLLFAGTVQVSTSLALLGGLVLAFATVGRAIGMELVARRRYRERNRGGWVGGAAGIPSVVILAALFGTTGGMWGELVAESANIATQVRYLRSPR